MTASILEEADRLVEHAVLAGDVAGVRADLRRLLQATRLETQAVRALRDATRELIRLLEEERNAQH